MKKINGYYFITDSSLSKNGNISDCKNAVKSSVNIIQYRNKNQETSTKKIYEEAQILKKICDKAIFIINDRVDIALAVEADGVHLGQKDLPCKIARKILGKDKIIGISVSSIEEAEIAYKSGADYLGVGPIFPTSTKKDAGITTGLELIKHIKNILKIPIVAIGGINLKNAESVILAGADSVCAISDVITMDDVKKRILEYQNIFCQTKK